MSKRLIITEEEKKTILSLYEQTDEQYKKENDFLKRYIGKSVNWYQDIGQHELMGWKNNKIINTDFDGERITLEFGPYLEEYDDSRYNTKVIFFCQYNPTKLNPVGRGSMFLRGAYGPTIVPIEKIYNKTFYDSLISSGIQWCKKPQADFGMNGTDKNNIG